MINKKTIHNINNQRKHLIIGIIIIIVAVIGLYAYFKYDELYPSTDDAYIEAGIVNVAPKVSGYIDSIYVTNNQHVNRGQILFTIKPLDYQLAYDQAYENYLSAKALAKVSSAQVLIALAQIKKDQAQYNFLQARANRYSDLYHANTIAKQEYQSAITDYQQIKSAIDIDRKKYNQNQSAHEYALTKQEAAQAALSLAQENLNYTIYKAPCDGYVTNLNNLSVGELVNASQQLFGLVNDRQWWVEANFKETDLKHIKSGQLATISLDMYDNHQYLGIVSSISNASGAMFSLLPPQNATGNWVKVTERFAVKIALIERHESIGAHQQQGGEFNRYPLRLGASAKVVIDTLKSH